MNPRSAWRAKQRFHASPPYLFAPIKVLLPRTEKLPSRSMRVTETEVHTVIGLELRCERGIPCILECYRTKTWTPG